MFETCRGCGCTNWAACEGGCWWVEDDLCSSCAIAVDVQTGDSLTDDELLGRWTMSSAGIFVDPIIRPDRVDDAVRELAAGHPIPRSWTVPHG